MKCSRPHLRTQWPCVPARHKPHCWALILHTRQKLQVLHAHPSHRVVRTTTLREKLHPSVIFQVTMTKCLTETTDEECSFQLTVSGDFSRLGGRAAGGTRSKVTRAPGSWSIRRRKKTQIEILFNARPVTNLHHPGSSSQKSPHPPRQRHQLGTKCPKAGTCRYFTFKP